MPKFYVTVPFAGSLSLTVEAADDEAAIAAAIDKAGESFRVKAADEIDINEIELLENLLEGNVCYAPCFYARAEEQDEE